MGEIGGITGLRIAALRAGTVPAEGLEHFAVGLEEQMRALHEQGEGEAKPLTGRAQTAAAAQ